MTDADAAFWLQSAVALLALLAAAGLAWRRRIPAEAPQRWTRIVGAAAALSAPMVLGLVIEEVRQAGLSWLLMPMIAVATLAFLLVGMVLFGLADFWLGLFGPRRTRFWLLVAVAIFGLLLAACFFTAFWAIGQEQAVRPAEWLQLTAIAAACAITWWTFLPPPDGDVAGLFD